MGMKPAGVKALIVLATVAVGGGIIYSGVLTPKPKAEVAAPTSQEMPMVQERPAPAGTPPVVRVPTPEPAPTPPSTASNDAFETLIRQSGKK